MIEAKSRISMEDYAVALVDEAGNPQYIRSRFTVGYLARIVRNA
jgi:uncharacterized protein